MPDNDLRPYIDHLMRGEFDYGELIQLLLYARERANGRASVREIGDYCAHLNQRDRGIVTDEARDFFLQSRVQVEHFGKPYDLANLSPAVPDAMYASLRRIDPKSLRKHAHVKDKAEAKALLNSLFLKLRPIDNGNLKITSSATAAELQTLKTLVNITTIKAVFSGDQFFEDLCAIFIAQNLLLRKELRHISSSKTGIILSAIVIMHRSHLLLHGSEVATLAASRDHGNLTVVMSGRVGAIPGPYGGPIHFARELFATKLSAEECCDESLLAEKDWEFPLRVTSSQKLARRI